MFKRLKTLKEMLQIIRSGKDVGDAAALKLTLLGEAEEDSPHASVILAKQDDNFRKIDPERLSKLPKDSFGFAYSEFMRRNGLHPFNFTSRVLEVFSRFPVSMRYVRLHDLIHVLLGFETDLVGEIGVYAFVGEQKYNRTLNKAAKAALRFGWLLFWKRKEIVTAQERGRRLGGESKNLILEPLEGMLERPLQEVRTELGLGSVSTDCS